MSNNIIKVALTHNFSPELVATLMEIAEATPNPTVAIEMILGVYSVPEVNTEPHPDLYPSEGDKVFIGYDKWKDEVQYKYQYTKEDGTVITRTSQCSLQRWNKNKW